MRSSDATVSPTGLSRRSLLAGLWATGGAAAASTALAACTAGGAPAPAAKVQEPVKLTYMHEWNQNQGHGPASDRLAARFSQEFAPITVESVYTSEYFAKLTAMIAGGDFPDIATYNLAFLPQLVKTGIVVPAETLSQGSYRFNKSDIVPAAREMVTFEGKVVSLPYIVNSSGLAYNQSLYKQKGLDPAKPPTTWAELVDQAKQLTGGGDQEVWGTVFPLGTADPISPLLAFIWQNGGQIVDEKAKKPLWTSPEAVDALQFMVDLVHRHRVAKYPQPPNQEQGNVGIWHLPPGTVSVLQKRVADAFEWNTAHLPKGKQQATTVGGHALSVLKTNKHHEAAWRFVHWFTSPPQEAEFLVASYTLPPWRAAEQQPAWQSHMKDQPRVKPFVEMLSYARPTPKITRWQDVIAILAAGRNAAGAQQKTPREALEDAARQAEPLIQEG